MLDDKDEFTRCTLIELVRNRAVTPETAKIFIEEAKDVYRFVDIEDWLANVSPDIAERVLLEAVDDIRKERENEKSWWLRVGSFIVW